MVLSNYQYVVRRFVEETARTLFDLPDGMPDFDLSPSAEPKFGHFACNLAMQLAGPLKRNPRQIGEELAAALRDTLEGTVERIEVAGPGFLNFHLKPDYLTEQVFGILGEDKPFHWRVENPKRINLEYVSANPTGPLLVVNGRAAAMGSALAEILKSVGHEVTEEYFVNDAGTQVIEFGKSVFRMNRDRYREAGWEIPDEVYCWGDDGGYAPDTVRAIADELFKQREEEADKVKQQKGRVEKLFDARMIPFEIEDSINIVIKHQKETLKNFNVIFGKYSYEHALYSPSIRDVIHDWVFPKTVKFKTNKGLIGRTYDLLFQRGVTYEAEGAVWLRTTDYGDEKDRVIVRSNGKPTYLLTDIAYHLDKWERLGGYESERLMINIWGPDHHGHILPTKAGLIAAGLPEDALMVLTSGWVTLKKGGETVSMSKRKGNIVTLDELLDVVGVDVARYMFLERSPEAHLDFDLDLAVQQSSENPAYYIQYAHARIESIFARAAEEGYSKDELSPTNLARADLTALFTEDDAGGRQRELIRQIIYYPGVIESAAKNYAPQKVAAYLHGLAGVFHPYYKKVKVLVEDTATALARLALCRSLQRLFAHGLDLLGIKAPESM